MRVMEGRDIDSMSILLLPFTHYPAGKLPYGAQTTIQSLSRPVHQRPSHYDQVPTILCRYVVGVVFHLITLTTVTKYMAGLGAGLKHGYACVFHQHTPLSFTPKKIQH